MFEETKTVVELTQLPAENTMQVKWRIQVTKDGEVISSKDHYKLYTADQKADFLTEVEGAEAYIAVLGWTVEE
jgi:hypothetical protein